MSKISLLSVVIPAYNEAPRIGKTIRTVVEYLQRQPHRWEILVVNDGSKDDIEVQIRSFTQGIPQLRLIQHRINQGKGAAVCSGLKAAQGDAVLFSDADGATPIEELEKLLPHLGKGIGMVVGSRRAKGSRVLLEQHWPRRMMSNTYQWICRLLVNPGVADVTCGFKLLTREMAQLCGSRMRIRRWSFDAEMFTIAKIHELKVIEIPIRWFDQRKTKVRLLRDIWGSFWELIRIRLYTAQGVYR